jgi:hypothetical protein
LPTYSINFRNSEAISFPFFLISHESKITFRYGLNLPFSRTSSAALSEPIYVNEWNLRWNDFCDQVCIRTSLRRNCSVVLASVYFWKHW